MGDENGDTCEPTKPNSNGDFNETNESLNDSITSINGESVLTRSNNERIILQDEDIEKVINTSTDFTPSTSDSLFDQKPREGKTEDEEDFISEIEKPTYKIFFQCSTLFLIFECLVAASTIYLSVSINYIELPTAYGNTTELINESGFNYAEYLHDLESSCTIQPEAIGIGAACYSIIVTLISYFFAIYSEPDRFLGLKSTLHIAAIASGIVLLAFIASSLACPLDYCATIERVCTDLSDVNDDEILNTCDANTEECCFDYSFQNDCVTFQGRLWLLLLFITIIMIISISRCCFACNPCVADPPVVQYVKEQRQYSAALTSTRLDKSLGRNSNNKESMDI